jgi:hypothetical protein
MGSQLGINALGGPFRGSEAVAAGLVTRGQLAGSRYRRVFRDVYVPAAMAVTHELRCECAALVLPADAVLTGRSAATLRGVQLALPGDPVEVVAGLQTRLFRRGGGPAALRGAHRRSGALVADPPRDTPPHRLRPAA